MINDLPNATSQDVAKRLVRLRHEMGAFTLGRVLTLVIDVDEADADDAIEAAADATRQSPSRIIVLVRGNRRGTNRLDAQIRLGGDAGASEIIVLRLYGPLTEQGRSVITPLLLADSPIVVWWPGAAPKDPATSPLGSMSGRRITDSATAKNPRKALTQRAETYAPGDTDLAWTRLTRWRGLLAAALDQPPYEPVTEATVTGSVDSPSADLLAAWLAVRLGCPVKRARSRPGSGLVSVRLQRAAGPIDLVRTEPTIATLTQPGQPVRRLNLVEPDIGHALAEELRRMDPDQPYAQALRTGLAKVGTRSVVASAAVSSDDAPDVEEARRAGIRAQRRASELSGEAMLEVPQPKAGATDAEVAQAAGEALQSKSDQATTPAKPGTKAGRAAADQAKKAAKRPTAKKAGAKSAAKKSAKKATAKTAKKAATKTAAKKAAAKKSTASQTRSSK